MAKIGNKPVHIPASVSLTFPQGIGELAVKGPLGALSQHVVPGVAFFQKEQQVTVLIAARQKRLKALQGLYRALLQNMVQGVSVGFTKRLELVGIGYKAALRKPGLLELSIGYSNPVCFFLPAEVKARIVEGTKNPTIELSSHDKQLLAQVTARLRSLRRPEPYKGKGIHRDGETVRRKAGKSAGK